MSGRGCLDEFVARVRARWNTHAVILYGSRARGDWKPWSDWDVLVVADFREPFLERLRNLMAMSCPGVEPLGYTPAELVEGLRNLNPAVISALVEGIVLYGGDYVEGLRRRIARAEKTSCTWRIELR